MGLLGWLTLNRGQVLQSQQDDERQQNTPPKADWVNGSMSQVAASTRTSVCSSNTRTSVCSSNTPTSVCTTTLSACSTPTMPVSRGSTNLSMLGTPATSTSAPAAPDIPSTSSSSLPLVCQEGRHASSSRLPTAGAHGHARSASPTHSGQLATLLKAAFESQGDGRSSATIDQAPADEAQGEDRHHHHHHQADRTQHSCSCGCGSSHGPSHGLPSPARLKLPNRRCVTCDDTRLNTHSAGRPGRLHALSTSGAGDPTFTGSPSGHAAVPLPRPQSVFQLLQRLRTPSDASLNNLGTAGSSMAPRTKSMASLLLMASMSGSVTSPHHTFGQHQNGLRTLRSRTLLDPALVASPRVAGTDESPAHETAVTRHRFSNLASRYEEDAGGEHDDDNSRTLTGGSTPGGWASLPPGVLGHEGCPAAVPDLSPRTQGSKTPHPMSPQVASPARRPHVHVPRFDLVLGVDVLADPEMQLGVGASATVLEGVFRGQRVAVKLLSRLCGGHEAGVGLDRSRARRDLATFAYVSYVAV
jgi:hypothetical protein